MARNIIGYFVYASFFTIIFLSGIINLKAQNARFLMETDRSQVHAGETFLLDIVLENIDGSNLQLPDIAPFKIVQGPSTSTSVTIINGKRSGSQKYQYLLLAPQKVNTA
ncbi:MAG: BatD family protein [Saprospiraceae bacterium]|nr:BatD family protein [Saprospiraceae bacterium]